MGRTVRLSASVVVAAVLLACAAALLAASREADAAFPGQNGKLAFSSNPTAGEGVDNPEGDHEIFVLNPDGTDLNQLTRNATDEYFPTFSPDGSKIAYSAPDGTYTMPAGGGEPTRVAARGGMTAFSPDGSKIAYAGRVPDEPATPDDDPRIGVYTVPVGGGEPTLVYGGNEGDASSPRWSPDGSKMAFTTGGGLWTVPAEGGTPTRLVAQNVYGWGGIDWSPDGKTVAFVSYATHPINDYHSIWTVPAAGGTPTNLTGGTYWEQSHPAWSPDGSRIAYVDAFSPGSGCGGGGPSFAIRTVPPGGGAYTEVVEEVAGYVPAGLDWGTSPWRTVPDTEPPTVECTGPVEGADDAQTRPQVTAGFSEELDPATITPDTFYLTKAGSGGRIGANVGCSERTCLVAALRPAEDLDYFTTYTATVEGGANGVKDKSGNALAEDKSWSFTTYDGIYPAVSLTAPTGGGRVSGTSVTLSAEATDNRGIKDVSFSVENDPAGADYVRVGADATPGGPSGNEYSVSWNSTEVPDGTKTVRAYATDVSGRSRHASAVVTVDNAVPRVVDVSPEARSRGVRRGVTVRATFSEEMRPATVRTATFRLVEAGTGKRVAATVSCPAPCTEAELDPSAPLAANTRYRATLTTGLEDTAGNALDQRADVAGDQQRIWSFETAG